MKYLSCKSIMNIKLKYPLRRTDETNAVVCLKIGEQSFFFVHGRVGKTRSKIHAGARRHIFLNACVLYAGGCVARVFCGILQIVAERIIVVLRSLF